MSVFGTEESFRDKFTVEEIRRRFDGDVEQFSNLETGQSAAMDSPLHLELVAEAVQRAVPDAKHLLDLGCGAGNYTLRLLMGYEVPPEQVTLVDLSRPMLDRAIERISASFPRVRLNAVQADVREFAYEAQRFDAVIAAQCLHHLRHALEWMDVFSAIHRGLKPGGVLWISDSLEQHHPAVRKLARERWGDYLETIRDKSYRDHVLAYVDKEDSPRSLVWQLEKMREVGLTDLDVLHVNGRFGVFGGMKSRGVTP
ncbi:MAG: class I SAM-dependent methyltransferase [Planctomycetota bacterium]